MKLRLEHKNLKEKNNVDNSDLHMIIDSGTECIIDKCSDFYQVNLVAITDTKNYFLGSVCDKHYDELMTGYYSKDKRKTIAS